MAQIRGPEFGKIGMPKGEHASSNPDLEDEKLVGAIETQGSRLAWSRAANCPCAPLNTQTKQPDPNCDLCRGNGLIYFGPENYVPPADAGVLTDVQKAILAVDGAALIKGVIARAKEEADLYDRLGHWMWGSMLVTVRPENKIGYYDRLVSLDSEIVFFETITVEADAPTVPTRYRATAVNLIRSEDTIYRLGSDFVLSAGIITWLPGRSPSAETILSVHYLTMPTWRVVDHPHGVREIGRRRKKRRVSPLGDPTQLPIEGRVQLEFLPVQGQTP